MNGTVSSVNPASHRAHAEMKTVYSSHFTQADIVNGSKEDAMTNKTEHSIWIHFAISLIIALSIWGGVIATALV